jgi:hypothetical protein
MKHRPTASMRRLACGGWLAELARPVTSEIRCEIIGQLRPLLGRRRSGWAGQAVPLSVLARTTRGLLISLPTSGH